MSLLDTFDQLGEELEAYQANVSSIIELIQQACELTEAGTIDHMGQFNPDPNALLDKIKSLKLRLSLVP